MKTKANNASVTKFLAGVKNTRRREDSAVVKKIMATVSGEKAKMWGPSIVGFGKYNYPYADGTQGEICTIGFSPRAQALTFYGITGFKNSEKLYEKLGKHKVSGGGCLYINKLEDVDLDVLERIITKAYQARTKKKNK